MCILLEINITIKICNAEELVLFANAKYPESAYDAAIWKNSKAWEHP